MRTPPTARNGLHTCACHLDCTMHAPGVYWHKLALNKKSHRCRASTFLMGGEFLQHWSSPPTYQAPKKPCMWRGSSLTQYILQAQNPPVAGRRGAWHPRHACKEPSGRWTQHSWQPSKYLSSHGQPTWSPHLITWSRQAPYATQQGQRSSSHAISPKGRELPVIAPELTSELLHCHLRCLIHGPWRKSLSTWKI